MRFIGPINCRHAACLVMMQLQRREWHLKARPNSSTTSVIIFLARPRRSSIKHISSPRPDDGLTIIDQHAAHERLVMERMKTALAESGVASQNLLLPEGGHAC
jgi:hypothetical protein